MKYTLAERWKNFEYKHTFVSGVVAAATVLLINTTLVGAVLEWFKGVGLVGGFVGGILSVSMFTTAPALLLINAVALHSVTWQLVLAASAGSVLGDWLIIKFLEDEVASELKPLLKKYHILPKVRAIQRSRGKWLVSALGALILALPLPDELGIALMDIAHIRRRTLLLICFALNTLGIYLFVIASKNFL